MGVVVGTLELLRAWYAIHAGNVSSTVECAGGIGHLPWSTTTSNSIHKSVQSVYYITTCTRATFRIHKHQGSICCPKVFGRGSPAKRYQIIANVNTANKWHPIHLSEGSSVGVKSRRWLPYYPSDTRRKEHSAKERQRSTSDSSLLYSSAAGTNERKQTKRSSQGRHKIGGSLPSVADQKFGLLVQLQIVLQVARSVGSGKKMKKKPMLEYK